MCSGSVSYVSQSVLSSCMLPPAASLAISRGATPRATTGLVFNIFNFLALVMWQRAALSSATQHTMPRDLKLLSLNYHYLYNTYKERIIWIFFFDKFTYTCTR